MSFLEELAGVEARLKAVERDLGADLEAGKPEDDFTKLLTNIKGLVANYEVRAAEGNETIEIMMDSFWQEFLASTPFEGSESKKKGHKETSLPPVLKDFELLGNCVVDLNGEEIRAVEARILENPNDLAAQRELLERTTEMTKRYANAIQERIHKNGRTQVWAKVSRFGNNSFKEVYTVIWNNTIASNEHESIVQYADMIEGLNSLIECPSITKQPTSDLVELYKQAAQIKPVFDALIHMVRKFSKRVALSICMRPGR